MWQENKEEKKRSLVKTITSKIMEISISAIVLQLIFGIPVISISLPFLLEGLQMIGYYIHERIWTRIKWGYPCEECHYKEFHERRRKEGKSHD